MDENESKTKLEKLMMYLKNDNRLNLIKERRTLSKNTSNSGMSQRQFEEYSQSIDNSFREDNYNSDASS